MIRKTVSRIGLRLIPLFAIAAVLGAITSSLGQETPLIPPPAPIDITSPAPLPQLPEPAAPQPARDPGQRSLPADLLPALDMPAEPPAPGTGGDDLPPLPPAPTPKKKVSAPAAQLPPAAPLPPAPKTAGVPLPGKTTAVPPGNPAANVPPAAPTVRNKTTVPAPSKSAQPDLPLPAAAGAILQKRVDVPRQETQPFAAPPAAPAITMQPQPVPPAASGPRTAQPIPLHQPKQPPSFRLIGSYRKTEADDNAAQNTVTSYKKTVGIELAAPVYPPAALPTALGVPAAGLIIDKLGPSTGAVGQVLEYEIVVRNAGPKEIEGLVIEDTIPATAQLVGSVPAGQVQGTLVSWKLDRLAPRGEQRYKVRLKALQAGVLQLQAAANLRVTKRTQTDIDGPSLELHIEATPAVLLGQKAHCQIEMSNRGTEELTGLLLFVRLGEGLKHPAGHEIEAELASLAPGASKIVDLHMDTIEAGTQTIVAVLSQGKQRLAQGQAELLVRDKIHLVLKKSGTQILSRGQTSEYRLEVLNRSSTDAGQVMIADLLPEGLEFVAASNDGRYDPKTRRVQWLLGTVRSGQTLAVGLKLRGSAAGEVVNQVTAQAGDGDPVGLTANLRIEETAPTAQAATPFGLLGNQRGR